MHELSICSAIADTVIEHAAGRPVERVRLRIGHLRQVVPDTLHFCWRMQTDDSPLRDAALEVTYVPATIRCQECASETVLEEPILVCAECGSRQVDLIAGEEFLIESIDVTDREGVL